MIHFHKWTKWVDVTLTVEPGPLSKRLDPRAKEYDTQGQMRVCHKCNKTQVRRIS